MKPSALASDADVIAGSAHRLSSGADYDRLIELASGAQLVPIGEAARALWNRWIAPASGGTMSCLRLTPAGL